jgi:hypothetical protein
VYSGCGACIETQEVMWVVEDLREGIGDISKVH